MKSPGASPPRDEVEDEIEMPMSPSFEVKVRNSGFESIELNFIIITNNLESVARHGQ